MLAIISVSNTEQKYILDSCFYTQEPGAGAQTLQSLESLPQVNPALAFTFKRANNNNKNLLGRVQRRAMRERVMDCQ